MRVLGGVAAGLLLAVSVMVTSASAVSAAEAGPTVERVRERGMLVCGLNPVPGFAERQEDGRWQGFVVDFCRAIAAAVLGDSERIDVVSVEGRNRFQALFSGSIDVLTEATTWTLTCDVNLPVEFTGIYLYDGQGFLAHRDLGLRSLAEAGEARVCAITDTTSIDNLQAHIKRNKLPLKVIPVQTNQGGWSSFLKRRCDIFTNDVFGLLARRALHSHNPDDYVLLSDIISKEPLSPVVRGDDAQWQQIVRWVVLAMIAGEEKGLCHGKLDIHPAEGDPEARILLGQSDDAAAGLGLQPGWAARVLAQVGCYGDVFDRNFGAASRLKGDRGLNRLWRDGGLLYAPPFH